VRVGSPSTNNTSAHAPAANSPRRPSSRSNCAAVKVALCSICTGDIAGSRRSNSPDWRSCMWPSKSVPNTTGTDSLTASCTDSMPRALTVSNLANISADQPSRSPSSASAA
jgi:hypothetical protein